ncbi:RluA family pseudouridine synthase [Siphonobacter sp. SORGH_AS_0500]|uniref:RluA family pseudouridine synthase n=1 Tax=Siphonobacter sp. SORGH_AS_0500 TaxID=1864824 RepID=UPI00286777A8|nr:RluA family pseudouridine synthase [Siphonobacter sp. SORGH_AS_0500]MDR6194304.1 23S rRNA pseudouridine1911/1915/1917 synthase [Siphonobacter sp. SORGH_AS_0500]
MQKKNSNAYEKKEDTRFAVTEPAELMTFLLQKFPSKNRNNIKSLLRDKQVLVNDKITFQFNHPLEVNDAVRVRWTKAPAEKQYEGIKIVFEDEHLIVIEKEEGILSMATEKEKRKTAYSLLSEHVKKQNPKNKIFIIHRLDRETSGLMMFAKSETVQKKMQESWQSTTKERVYLAVINGSPKKTEDTITSYLVESEKSMMVYSTQNAERGQKAVTHYETVQQNRYFSMLKVSLETGRKNQVRVHLQSIGHPIVGDKKYGSNSNPINRLALHAWVLAFQHPITKEQMHFETAIPTKFASLMNR